MGCLDLDEPLVARRNTKATTCGAARRLFTRQPRSLSYKKKQGDSRVMSLTLELKSENHIHKKLGSEEILRIAFGS